MIVALTIAWVAGLGAAPARAAASSPVGEALVFTANLQEAFGDADVADRTDMNIFVERVATLVPYAPDVLLLQEVRRSSAAYVARRLSAATGVAYRLAVDPGPTPWRQTKTKVHKQTTAIVLNTATMTALDAGGFVTTTYRRAEGSGGKPDVKYHAHLLAQKSDSRLSLPLASVHLPPAYQLASKALSDAKRTQWSRRVASYLAASYPGAAPAAIGGDFNSGPCAGDPSSSCDPAPFWAELTSSLRYRDAIRALKVNASGVDYVFSKGGVVEAGIDSTYPGKAAVGNPDIFYSDHRFRWALISSDDVAPTAPEHPRARVDEGVVHLTWTPSTDAGGSGQVGYEVWRAGPVNDFRLIDRTAEARFADHGTYRNRDYRYRIVAYDRANNRSAYSAELLVRR